MMKRKVFCVLLLLFLLIPFGCPSLFASATTNSEAEEQILEDIDARLEDIDLSSLQEYYEENVSFESFSLDSLKDVLMGLISGEVKLGFDEIINLVVASLKPNIASVLKLVCLIVIIAGFGAFSEMLQSQKEKSGVGSVVSLIILMAVLSIATTIIADFASETISLLKGMSDLSVKIFPILVSMVVVLGGTNVGASIQPAIVFLTNGVISVISSLSSFAVISYFVLSVVGELTDNIKLDKLKSLVSSIYKWAIGLIFTVFMGYMSINGIVGSGRDGLTIKTAKYALKNYIPMVGGYLSDSYELFRVGSELIKNSVGVVGVVLLFGMVIKKVVTLGVYKLGFMLASGITEPFGTKKITRFLSSLSTLFNFLIVGIVASFLMIVITIFILMSVVGA